MEGIFYDFGKTGYSKRFQAFAHSWHFCIFTTIFLKFLSLTVKNDQNVIIHISNLKKQNSAVELE